MEVEGDYHGEVEATLVELGATGLMTQESKPGRTMVFDACNGFNELIRLAMLWTVWHHCLAGGRFVFDFYKHWPQLLLRQSGDLPVTLLSREGVNQG